VLDFVQSKRARQQLVSFGRQAGRDETGGQNAHVWLLTEPPTKLQYKRLPTAF
jgi:hypothetical protein